MKIWYRLTIPSILLAFAAAIYDLASYPHLANGPGREPTWLKITFCVLSVNAIIQLLWTMIRWAIEDQRKPAPPPQLDPPPMIRLTKHGDTWR